MIERIIRKADGTFDRGTKIWNKRQRQKDAEVDIHRYYGERAKDLPEPDICKKFGCGRKLTYQEKLFGDKCQSHSIL